MADWNTEDCEQEYTPNDDPSEFAEDLEAYYEWLANDENEYDRIPF